MGGLHIARALQPPLWLQGPTTPPLALSLLKTPPLCLSVMANRLLRCMPFGSPVPPFAPRPCLRPVQQMPKVSETEKKLNALCDNAVQLAGQAVHLQHQGEDTTHEVLGRHLINQTPKQFLKMVGHTSQLHLGS